MLPELGRIGPVVIHTYTVLLDVAFLVGLIALARRGLHTDQNPAAWVDVGLIALLGGIMGGRAAHVAVHWSYFSNHLGETYRVWLGGLDWHGAVAGGIPGLLLGARLRGVGWVDVLDVMSWVLPVGSILGSLGCLMSRCGYGREVATLADYPLVIASELPDIYGIVAPRLNSQLFAMAAG
nr:prolipoprotein diacylglyceryl transferase [Anaerolineae bacterium]